MRILSEGKPLRRAGDTTYPNAGNYPGERSGPPTFAGNAAGSSRGPADLHAHHAILSLLLCRSLLPAVKTPVAIIQIIRAYFQQGE
jgi:hypothetical protein